MEKIVSLCKRRGFIYPSSEIYGGIAGFWDYGPLGVELRHHIKQLFWQKFISNREEVYPVSTSIVMSPRVWEASGHVKGFADPMVECLNCNYRERVDVLIKPVEQIYSGYLSKAVSEAGNAIKEYTKDIEDSANLIEYYKTNWDKHIGEKIDNIQTDVTVQQYIVGSIQEGLKAANKFEGNLVKHFLNIHVSCSSCKARKWGMPRAMNMMFRTFVGGAENEEAVVYFRPETAQGMFVNFKNIVDSFHPTLPFGIAQIGKSFRNEISPRDFIFRQREFEQMELEYFVDPRDEAKVNDIFEELHGAQMEFLEEIGLSKEKIHKIEVPAEDRAHYSKRSVDTEFDFPFGQKELLGIAYRTDYDLKAHADKSGADLSYYDEETKERFVPHCIEPTMGVDRLVMAVLSDAYTEDELGGETRAYLKLHKNVAPVRAAVFPLLKNKPALVEKAREVYKMLKKEFPNVEFDDNGNIGKRYRRQDEIGTPFCITIDFGTLGEENPELKDTVTLRDRDSGEQKRVSISELSNLIK